VKSNRLLTFILSGAMLLPMAALAQTSNQATAGSDKGSSVQAPRERGERGEMFAQELNLTPEQKAELKSLRETEKQQAQAIKNDSSLTSEQKKAKFHELRKSSHEQMMAKLTPEQQQKFKEFRKEHRGHRGGHRGKGKSGETQG
jgi:Spy/CpxP family protein refolding chaperone